MFNLYFTDWNIDGTPIPNGQAVLDYLTKQGIKELDQPAGKYFFNRTNFEQMCKIAGYSYNYTNEFVDNFLFLICYELDPPVWDLVVPLESILTPEIVLAINNKGFLVFSDNEGWLQMPDILRKQATNLGVLPEKIICITADPMCQGSLDIFYNYQEESCFYRVIEGLKYPQLLSITKTKPTKLFTSLVGTANPSKIEFLNKLVTNNLFDEGNISFIKLKDRYRGLVDSKLLEKHPIIIDSSTDYFSNFVNTIPIAASSYINIVHSSDPKYEPNLSTMVVSNNDLFTSVASKRPFLTVNYSKHKLDYIRLLGYKTFSEHFSEDYDLVEDKDKRVDSVICMLKQLKSKELDTLLLAMSDILDYNFNHFFRRTNRNSHVAVKKLNEIINAN